MINCPRCGGSGNEPEAGFNSSNCEDCNGTGRIEIKSSYQGDLIGANTVVLKLGEIVINKAERDFILKELENSWTDHESYEIGKELFRKLRGED